MTGPMRPTMPVERRSVLLSVRRNCRAAVRQKTRPVRIWCGRPGSSRLAHRVDIGGVRGAEVGTSDRRHLSWEGRRPASNHR